jgi:mRNA-degrading endonuclease RelE of RelBE toxin-antitoxin system
MNLPNKRDLHRTKPFAKDLKKLPPNIKQQCWAVVQLLAENIFHPALDIKKLQGYENVWRVKVKQVYRLVYSFDERALYLLRIAHRKNIYRKPFQELD